MAAVGLGGVRWGGGEPGFGGPAAAVAARCALEAAGFFEDGEGAVDLAGLLVAAEEVADLGAADACRAVFGECPDVVGGRVAEAVAEDPAGGFRAVAPDREGRFEVREADALAAVQRRVDRGEPDDVRFSSASRGAEEAVLAA